MLAYCLSRRVGGTLQFWTFGATLALAIGAYVALSALDPWTHSRTAAWGVRVALGLLLPLFSETSSMPVRQTAAWLAKYSYGICLSHMISLWPVFLLLPGPVPLAVQLGVLACLLAIVPMALYHSMEAPGIRVGAACAAWMRRPSGALPTSAA